jgi:glyoxylase-like metal-dependent hydrolase (beta-lactamase superfamily II)
MKLSTKTFMAFITLLVGATAWAGQGKDLFTAQKVTDHVYAYIGPTTDRTPENLGLNNNIGFIDTKDGWVLVDSGAGDAAAEKLEEIAHSIKKQPIVAVINVGSQDHRWLGNDYFSKRGAKIYAYQKSVNTQQQMYQQEMDRLLPKVPALKGTKMKTADIVFEEASNTLTIGGVEMHLNYYGDAHFPGDSVLWLPQQKVLFTGDIVYVDRMLGVHPWSNPVTWNEAYQTIRQLPAKYIIPGHGQVCDWKKADADTGNYLKKLVNKMTMEAEEFSGVGTAVKNNADWPEFQHLDHYDSWHKQNLNRTYLKIESTL